MSSFKWKVKNLISKVAGRIAITRGLEGKGEGGRERLMR
jgi:hypothetical protein